MTAEQLRKWIFDNYPNQTYIFPEEYNDSNINLKVAKIINSIFKYKFKRHSETIYKLEEVLFIGEDKELYCNIYSFCKEDFKYKNKINYLDNIIIQGKDFHVVNTIIIFDSSVKIIDYGDGTIKRLTILCIEKQLDNRWLLWFLVINKFWIKFFVK